MTTKDEALKLALEALEECRRDPRLKYEHPYYDKALAAIREALAEQSDIGIPISEQPAQQEPVAWRPWNDQDGYGFWETKQEAEPWCAPDFFDEPLYTSPPASKPLTLPQIAKALADAGLRPEDYREDGMIEPLVRAIEAAHGIKGDA